jgi:hypothetical protein
MHCICSAGIGCADCGQLPVKGNNTSHVTQPPDGLGMHQHGPALELQRVGIACRCIHSATLRPHYRYQMRPVTILTALLRLAMLSSWRRTGTALKPAATRVQLVQSAFSVASAARR